MIKASEGGGGKGIRMVHDPLKLQAAFGQVQGEVPGSPIFIMKLAPRSRHLEVQLLADEHGNAIALSGRDCSVQRRHQKIVEEGPPVAAPPDVWRQMEQAAVRLAKAVGYANAGTVEYLFSEDGQFYFLELNPRLQVEHPVTEMITGVNLPACQLQVAMGLPLKRIPDIQRLYTKEARPARGPMDLNRFRGDSFTGSEDMSASNKLAHYDAIMDKIDLDEQSVTPHGHVIAARITAENAEAGFTPTSGSIEELNFRSLPQVWGYFSVDSSGRVHEYADSQIGHLFSWGADRDGARRNLVLALRDLSIRGAIHTSVEYVSKMLESDDFVANNLDTFWLDERIRSHAGTIGGPADGAEQVESHSAPLVAVIGAISEAHGTAVDRMDQHKAYLERGQVPPQDLLNLHSKHELIYRDVKYCMEAKRSGPNSFMIALNGDSIEATVRLQADGGRLVFLGGKSYTTYESQEAEGTRLVIERNTYLFTDEYDPTRLTMPNSGKLVRYVVPDGASIKAGEPYAEIEVMKMFMPLVAPEDGTAHFTGQTGGVLEAGAVVGSLDLDDPSKVKKSVMYEGALPALLSESRDKTATLAGLPHLLMKRAQDTLTLGLNGYHLPAARAAAAIGDLDASIDDPSLAACQLDEVLSSLNGRIPIALSTQLHSMLRNANAEADGEEAKAAPAEAGGRAGKQTLDLRVVSEIIRNHCAALPAAEAELVAVQVAPITAIADQYSLGVGGYRLRVIAAMLQDFVGVEEIFTPRHTGLSAPSGATALLSGEALDPTLQLRHKHEGDLGAVYEICLSHCALSRKAGLINLLFGLLEACLQDHKHGGADAYQEATYGGPFVAAWDAVVTPVAVDLASFVQREYSSVTLAARQLLVRREHPSFDDRQRDINNLLSGLVCPGAAMGGEMDPADPAGSSQRFRELIGESTQTYDPLNVIHAFGNADQGMSKAALRMYVGRTYRMYHVDSIEVDHNDSLRCVWQFRAPDDDSVAIGMAQPSSFDNLERLGSDGIASDDGMGEAKAAGGMGMKSKGGSMNLADAALDDASPTLGARTLSGGDATPMNGMVGGARTGMMLVFDHLADAAAHLEAALQRFPSHVRQHKLVPLPDPTNVLHVALLKEHCGEGVGGNTDMIAKLAELIRPFHDGSEALAIHGIRRITFVLMPKAAEGMLHSEGSVDCFTFRASLGFQEDNLVRHTEPTMAFQLDMARLANFNIRRTPTELNTIHLYEAVPLAAEKQAMGIKDKGARAKSLAMHRRYFARALVHDAGSISSLAGYTGNGKKGSGSKTATGSVASHDVHPGPEIVFVETLNALEIALNERPSRGGHHIFLNVLEHSVVKPEYIEGVIRNLAARYADRLKQLRIREVEFKITAQFTKGSPKIPLRLVATNPTGFATVVDAYVEAKDESTGNVLLTSIDVGAMRSASASTSVHDAVAVAAMASASDNDAARVGAGELDGKFVDTPYPVQMPLSNKRQQAQVLSTLYCYDFLDLFERGVQELWHSQDAALEGVDDTASFPLRPVKVVASQEIALRATVSDEDITGVAGAGGEGKDGAGAAAAAAGVPCLEGTDPDGELVAVTRPAGQNSIGMVAWLVTMYTPTHPAETGGMTMVLIANDITTVAGSFGVVEDALFREASEYARKRGLPRVYLAANSGARIGMAKEVQAAFRVAWNDESDPLKGYQYLYLTPDDARRLDKSVNCAAVEGPRGEERHRIVDVIGAAESLGVENLRGSGEIAGCTSRAYDDTYTLTYVTGRTVGIGAYLVRLGQRTIQKRDNAPILLTGFMALNKLMGKEVYRSNAQLGGTPIMYPNGVSHTVVDDDMAGVKSILEHLSFVPARRGAALPVVNPLLFAGDSPDRDVEYEVTNEAQDPRLMLTGHYDTASAEAKGEWCSGFFDKDSFHETLAGWAQTVITGRARLGGIPIGVVVPEERTTESVAPADPANPESGECRVQQAGQVWFPDSAYKTSQAIADFNREELPLIIFANWRGFSGGQRDMFDQVLKYGALIVDALVEYKQPVFVYIPPHGMLRGGAWVVVDPTINRGAMEMFAAPEARGGVLEPSGIVEIKFRVAQRMEVANRLDPELRRIAEALKGGVEGGVELSGEARQQLKAEAAARQDLLAATYLQVAQQLADLHDTPGRMLEKGVISQVVPFRKARSFFYWRLRRRLAEFSLRRHLAADADIETEASEAVLRDMFLQSRTVRAGGMQQASQPAWQQYAAPVRPGTESKDGGAGGEVVGWSDDKKVLAWMSEEYSDINARISKLRRAAISGKVLKLGMEDPTATVQGVLSMIDQLDARQREKVVATLRRGVIFVGGGGAMAKGGALKDYE